MNYEIITRRWACAECGSKVRLRFEPASFDLEGKPDGYACRAVSCEAGHPLDAEALQLTAEDADQEFQAAFESGRKIAEVWGAYPETMNTDTAEEP